MDTASYQEVRDIVDKSEKIAIAVGSNPTLDTMGAALSLYLSFSSLGKQASIASPTEPVVEISSLVGIDKVKTYFSQEGGDLSVSFPYIEGEIEKVSYTLEGGLLNIIVKAGSSGLTFQEKDVQFKRGGSGVPSTLFIVGTPRLSDLGNLFDPEALKNTTVINIDNKRDNQGFGDVVLVSSSFSSVSEQIANLLTFLDYAIDVDIAQNLFSGISNATENFQNPKTSITAFEMAAVLLKKGAVRQRQTQQRAPFNEGTTSSFFPQPMQQIQQVQNGPKLGSFPKLAPNQPPRDRFKPKFPTQPFPRQQPMQRTGSNVPVSPLPEAEKQEKQEETPPDWLTPKVYKSSNLA